MKELRIILAVILLDWAWKLLPSAYTYRVTLARTRIDDAIRELGR